MNAIFNLVIAATLFGLAWLIWGATRPRPSDTAHRANPETNVGPDALQLLQDLDTHLDAYAARLGGLYERSGSPSAFGPGWDEGRERLWDAIRDEHNKGDQ